MTANINPISGLPYGVIRADQLHPETVHEMLYGAQAVNRTFRESEDDYLAEAEREDPDYNVGAAIEAHSNDYQADEEDIEGVLDGVSYSTAWLGGALHFYIFESPVTAKGRPCSPCAPNALDCGSVGKGDYEGYFVPADWLAEDAT